MVRWEDDLMETDHLPAMQTMRQECGESKQGAVQLSSGGLIQILIDVMRGWEVFGHFKNGHELIVSDIRE